MTRYELIERIGRGGMAEIFRGRAIAAGGFEKPVAIKRILPHLSKDERFVKLLISEANVLGQLRNRNIVQIYDVGLGDDKQYFLVMEYVEGTDVRTLYDALERRQQKLPVELALHIGAELCDALEYAHNVRGNDGQPLNLVHRDISPGNILLSSSGEVKLTDFGIAKVAAEDHTAQGGLTGKYAYISPEQASGHGVSAKSDIFSLGVVLYELIGARLFSGMESYAALNALMEGRIPPLRAVAPHIDPDLEATLMKALSPDPAGRYSAARELGDALRTLRYKLPQSESEPTKQIAQLVRSIARERDAGSSEQPMEVRIETAAGFGLPASEQIPQDHAAPIGAAPLANASPPVPMQPSDQTLDPRPLSQVGLPRHSQFVTPTPPGGRKWLMIIAVVLTSVASFAIAGAILRSQKSDGDSVTPDAAQLPDAQAIDAAPPDAAKPKKKKKRRTKRKKRRRTKRKTK